MPVPHELFDQDLFSTSLLGLDLLWWHIKAIKVLPYLELLFLVELEQVLYQEITVVALGALVLFLVVELTLAKTMDLLIHMAEQTLLVRIVLFLGAAATSNPYWSSMAETFTGGAARTSSFTCDNIGGLPCGTPCFPLLHLLLHHQGPRVPIFLLACSIILEDITLLLGETANFRIVLPSIPQDLGDLTSKLKTGKSRRPSSGSC
ncbi:PREDICTED: uncharacterized protein LOC105108530 [Populus euphratica]|uniref:Uncharacterized protein LOC105108530 n=1 Tax=Populus euphratica TaxID=75702 RepID=A0AAJ6SZD9_POPEU|nr:PREDICTED: uncharacterized protein LOC105108530 [Populus euphratica]